MEGVTQILKSALGLLFFRWLPTACLVTSDGGPRVEMGSAGSAKCETHPIWYRTGATAATRRRDARADYVALWDS
ncbi:hypothetical protein BDY21DRAFT_355190 [Lineolata rhizophorae]|uniref:Secreted protein n=1 Tax=Lineolata rhizophorae TaxID=578093 RepID=A0A6A6NQ14_9PEZI|nr:hypothetical protein BDY21DRAFT_355190 [Lineolata rhizophorae]